jgi:hypothetical protein
MRLSLFDAFADMIETISPRAIIRALEREHRMLQEDLAYQRPVPPKEAASILNFCRFVEAVKTGAPVQFPAAALPARHLEFYRETVGRLVDAEELPFNAKAEFDNMICSGHPEPLDGFNPDVFWLMDPATAGSNGVAN